jgi:hypothetical protein
MTSNPDEEIPTGDLTPGDAIGPYTLVEMIGEGGCREVDAPRFASLRARDMKRSPLRWLALVLLTMCDDRATAVARCGSASDAPRSRRCGGS